MHVPDLWQKLSRLIFFWQFRQQEPSLIHPVDETPLRAELFSIDQLERHAKIIAGLHRLASGKARDELLPRLDENHRILNETYDLVTAAADQNRRIEPAAEWLLDNFYLVEEQIRAIRRLLPPSYSRELPRLASGTAASFPRIYAIALELISHVDGRVDADSLTSFIASYQSVETLKLGELWALPLMLRLALIENLRRVSVRIASARRDRDLANDWADRMVKVVEQKPTDLVLVIADMARTNPPLSGAFLAELTRHLQGQNPNFAFANSWLEHRLADQLLTIEQVVHSEGQTQAADQVSIGNSINSLRFLNSNDWRQFVENNSLVEQTLARDPAQIYPNMDFATRDRYRRMVEEIARRSQFTENEIALKAVQLAENHQCGKTGERASHVGYYLIDRGRTNLESLAKMHLTPGLMLDKLNQKAPLISYLLTVTLVTLFVSFLFKSVAEYFTVSWQWFLLLAIPVLICASQVGVSLINWISMQLLRPHSLPRMDYEQGIPPEHRALVAIPTMLTSATAVEHLLEGLELRYLANRDPSLHFALITDLVDAESESLPDDAHLVNLMREGMQQLQERYSHDRPDIFFLFHRSRKWNPQENVWMGRERKRGKLADLNATLRGAQNCFSEVVGNIEILQTVQYVITLDTDTQLPRDAARLMVGTLAHRLNHPVYNTDKSRVVDGHTILQPRVGVSLNSAQQSRFVQLYAGEAGIDPYTRVVSDVYQDLFGEGSFIGKGIYDVDSFEQSCSDFPENTILSHDLIEGAYCRSALVSDVTLYEEYPSRYLADIGRRHRWIRGDWQIAGWLLPWVRNRQGQSVRNPISALSWWKIFDNLRRSLITPAMLSLLLVSWFISPAMALSTSIFLICIIFLPPMMDLLTKLLDKPADFSYRMHARETLQATGRPLGQNILNLVFLPYEAYICSDAIIRTLVRLVWTKHRLLEWKTASDSERGNTGSLSNTIYQMLVAPGIACCLALVFYFKDPLVLSVAAPWLAGWFLSPVIAWWLSRPILRREVRLSETEQHFLEKLARKTWRYFEEYVSKEDHWLPPDNIQQNPELVIATRTSPTNIGMALLSNLAAYDYGYSSAAQFLTRTRNTLKTLNQMERHRGHFFNWYDTRSLKPLHPQYISMVDSGNLAGNLLILCSGCQDLSHSSILPKRMFAGLRDTLRVLLDVAQRIDGMAPDTVFCAKIERQLEILDHAPVTLQAAHDLLADLEVDAAELTEAADCDEELAWWTRAYERSCREHRADLLHQAVWLTLPEAPDGLFLPQSDHQSEEIKQLTAALQHLDNAIGLRDVAKLQSTALPLIQTLIKQSNSEITDWLIQLDKSLSIAAERSADRIRGYEELEVQCRDLADMDFGLLYDTARDLFAIGYNVSERRLDSGFYDLLASEARLASFIVVAQGHFGQEHWFALGRLLTSTKGQTALVSWSGSMFEYLMPLLIMPNYKNTLLDRTYHAVVRRQIEYGRKLNVPWGISESGYNALDQHRIYQYRAFGVPGLGLKRGLAEDLVIAPYASVMALMVNARAACANLQRLEADGQLGTCGFYEAIDYTPSRLPPGAESATVRQFMAHHEGMSLLALAYVLLDKPMQRRFLADPVLRAAEQLLQERVPRAIAPVHPHKSETRDAPLPSPEETGSMRVITNPASATVESHLLSNGNYHVTVTSAGGGCSRWHDLAVTRWREDATRDNYGSFCYLRDINSGAIWSNTWQPIASPAKGYEAIFTQARAEFRRSDEKIETYTQISVSPEDDIELRRITLTNRSEKPRKIEVTSYAEVVLATQPQDEAHPAFSNLFVQTELVHRHQAIYCTRRPRSIEEHPPWMTHMMTVRGVTTGTTSYETDRMQFIGRQRTLASPAAFDDFTPLSNSAGPVLDPIVSIRQTVLLAPSETVRIDIVTGVSESRTGVDALSEKYSDHSLADRVFDLAWTHGHILLQQLSASEMDAQVYGRLSSSIIYASSLRRAKMSILTLNRQGQSGLWAYGISGDLPIVLVRIRDHVKIELVRQAIKAHAYWRLKGLAVDLVIWNEDDSVYRQTLQDEIADLIAASPEAALNDKPGGIFVRRVEQMSEEDRILLQSVARIILSDDAGTIQDQAERFVRTEVPIPHLVPIRSSTSPLIPGNPPQYDLAYFNGLGGFSQDGREYVTILPAGETTPAPWVNVIANSQLGTVVSEGGSAYTWSENSHEFRLTPWHNDPVSDLSGEAIYIRDEETGHFWSPSPLPARGQHTYITRHGFGYSIFDYTEDGLTTELCVYVATDAPVKFCKLKITNRSGRPRQLSVTGFWELVLGDSRSKSAMHIVTEKDPMSDAILARNVYSPEFSDRVAFFNCSEMNHSFTGDRTEFLGRNGNLAKPLAMQRVRLSGRVGAGFDPCAAIQTPLQLADGQERIITFTIGAACGAAETKALAQKYRSVESADQAIEGVWDYWSRTLGVIHLETPDSSVNFLANGWLVYQTLACRMWARSGFYQSGGAFGFRDQLQDAMALVYSQPQLLREHLLRAAAHQFQEGDVQHWWHPPVGRGVRTHFSDDYLWLPLAICRYVKITGDTGILTESVPFLTSRPLREDEESNYDLPEISGEIGTLFEHGIRAIENGLRFGEHGLPLMGCGDWNDGMNLVGAEGRGESVWLGFFLYHVLIQFSELARKRGEERLADRYTAEAERLHDNIEQHGWDGEWYRRAYFDDGTPLGSSSNEECQIDAIAQSWSILSGAGPENRTTVAMQSVDRRLIDDDERLIRLLDPPFDKSDLNPGYIKGYVPGVRENGGQYTHSAIWTVMATAAMGNSRRAWDLFSLINPVSHGSTPDEISTYRVEPYVVAADVYGVPPHTGRGGWTWYTGSAGWMYRLIVESLLGLELEVDRLRIAPHLPADWPTFKMHYRYRETFYHITIHNSGTDAEVSQMSLDGVELPDLFIPLIDDHLDHEVEIMMQMKDPPNEVRRIYKPGSSSF